MKILESRLRDIIKEELLREQFGQSWGIESGDGTIGGSDPDPKTESGWIDKCCHSWKKVDPPDDWQGVGPYYVDACGNPRGHPYIEGGEHKYDCADYDPNRSVASIESAISSGNDIDSTLMTDMREKAIDDFSFLYVEFLTKERDKFISDNPGIESWEDLSPEKIRSIKESAAHKALAEYKSTRSNTLLISDYIARLERVLGKPIPPTFQQLMIRYAKDFAYQFIFGFIDNAVLILAGAAIDDYIKMIFGADKLKKALTADDLDFITDGVGNTISDGVGDLGGGAVDRNIDNWSWIDNAATDGQLEIATPMEKVMAKTATFTGVILGCVAAIPVGILALKGLTSVGLTAAAGISTPVAWFTGVGAFAIVALTGITMYQEFKLLDKSAQDAVVNALSRIASAVYKHRRLSGDESLPEIHKYTDDIFTSDLKDPEIKAIAQVAWTDEMDLAKLVSTQDVGSNTVWRVVDELSNKYGFNNPNRTTLEESRLQKLAGLI
tara:strand:+ start:4455 stop:5939 length:1485 start_codon:yes stop_codon:yes gene_type:complete